MSGATWLTWVMVLVGGGLGAPLRFLVDRAVQARHRTAFPWGTFTVNVSACAVLGLLTGAVSAVAVPAALQALVGTGLCGALSTYSTFSYETVRLLETGARRAAVANVVVSVTAGLGAAVLGTALGGAIWG